MATYLPGTKIKISDLNRTTDIRTGERYEDMLRKSDDKNDTLFHIMYEQQGSQGKGQGNPFVGKLQSGQYKMTEGPTWAEEAVQSESGTSDIYRARDEGGGLLDVAPITGVDYGKPLTADDIARSTPGVTVFVGTNIPTAGFSQADRDRLNASLKNAYETGSEFDGQDTLYAIVHQAAKNQGIDPESAVGKQFMSDRLHKQGSMYQFTPESGFENTTYADIVTKIPSKGTSDQYNIRDSQGNIVRTVQGKDYAGPAGGGGVGTGWNVGGPGGPAGETSLLAYRPGSEAYWKSYMGPDLTGSLMRMKQPAIPQAALSYLPGEQRHPFAWLEYLGMGGMNEDYTLRNVDKQFQGAIPQGVWSNDPQRYRALTQDRVVPGYEHGTIKGYEGAPWQFAAQPSPMIAQPAWTPYDISPQAAGQWTGLLGDWAAPALNTTNLLGVA
jgi:hypothetical protein